MISRAVGLGIASILLAFSCSASEDEPGGGGAGAGPEGGDGAGGAPTDSAASGGNASSGVSGGGNASEVGGGAAIGAAGSAAGTCVGNCAGGQPSNASGGADLGGSAGIGGADAGGGGTDDGGAVRCITEVGVMPASPLAPAAPECASACSVPPFDGVTLPAGCGDANNAPPAAAIGDSTGVPPGGWIVVNGQATQTNGSPMTGGPCDVGWCPTFTPQLMSIGYSTSAGPYTEDAVLKAGVGEVAHLARTQSAISFDYAAISPTGFVSVDQVDVEHYSDYVVAPGQGGGWVPWGDPKGAVIGVDTRPGNHPVYIAYAGVWSSFPSVRVTGPRFGAVTHDSQTFEDLPEGWDALQDIQVDEHGDAIVLQKGVVYRHDAAGWKPVSIPCGVTPSQLVIDGASATWYVLGADSALYQRDAQGDWSKTSTPGGQLIVAGGTVHMVGQGIVHRVGTAWSQPLVAPNQTLENASRNVAIDACWAPHLVSWRMYDPFYLFEIDYTRWTARGFLTLRRTSNDFPDTKLTMTVGHVFVHGGGQIFVLPIR